MAFRSARWVERAGSKGVSAMVSTLGRVRPHDPAVHQLERIVGTDTHAPGWIDDAAWSMRATVVEPIEARCRPAMEELIDRVMALPKPATRQDEAWLIWGLGAASLGGCASIRGKALEGLERFVEFTSTDVRSNALVVLGSAFSLRAYPDSAVAGLLMRRAGRALLRPRPDDAWPWPEPTLGSVNAVVPDALMSAGALLGDVALVGAGQRLLRWLVGVEMAGQHFSFTGCLGRGPGQVGPAFDQDVRQAAAMSAACASAYRATGEGRWARAARRAAAWFNGANDLSSSLIDVWHGQVSQTLTAHGPSAVETPGAYFAARTTRFEAANLSTARRRPLGSTSVRSRSVARRVG